MVFASRAFQELPSSYATQQSVLRFCFGLYETKVAMHVSKKRQKTMEEALDIVQWYNHVNSTVDSPSISREKTFASKMYLLFMQSPYRILKSHLQDQI